MKINTKLIPSQTKNLLDIAFDIGKDRLYYYGEVPIEGNAVDCFEGDFQNRNQTVEEELRKLNSFANTKGYSGLRIICEPTGGFERRLLQYARKCKHSSAYVNPEAVYKMQVVQSNDYNKTDKKDPKTIYLLAKLNKVLHQRNLQGPWLVLRECNVRYERLEKRMVELKNRIYRVLRQLFCELSFSKDWIFEGKAAESVVDAYGLNPYRILASGKTRVRKKLLKLEVKENTIRRLLEDATVSVLQELDGAFIEFLEEDLRMEFDQLKYTQRMMLETREKMISLLDGLSEKREVRIEPKKDLISPFMLSRIIAETGPLDDFVNIQQLYRYGGLNIRQKESGKFKGQNKLSKKGRPLLRKVLNQAILARVTKKGLYGEYYHGKKETGMMGPKAMVSVSRKMLKMLFGIHRSKEEYDASRVFISQSEYLKEAA